MFVNSRGSDHKDVALRPAVLRSIHLARARTLDDEIDRAAIVPVSARLNTRTNHLQISPYTREHRTTGTRLDIFENDVVERIALDLGKPQQRFAGVIPAIYQHALLLFSVVPGWQKAGGGIAPFRDLLFKPLDLLLVRIRFHAERFQKAYDR